LRFRREKEIPVVLKNSDDMEHSDSPITPPEGDIGEQELLSLEPELESEPKPAPVPPLRNAPGGGWNWIGSPDREEAQESSDGISDLFEVDGDMTDTQDLVSVDIERDILDAGPDGDLSDLVEVSDEDIMGDEETGQIPLDYKPDLPRRKTLPRYRRSLPRYEPPTSLGGLSA
jgi:hypothetical protein